MSRAARQSTPIDTSLEALPASDAVLVVIGRSWLTAERPNGRLYYITNNGPSGTLARS